MSKRSTLARSRASATRIALAALVALSGLSAARAADPVAVDRPAVADFRVVHTFDGEDGGAPYTTLVRSADGAMAGTTWNYGPGMGGTVFRLDTAGQLTTLAAFGWNNSAGPTGPVLLAADGNFYGVGDSGSSALPANLFRVTPTGSVQYLHTFPADADATGSNPSPGLVAGPDGALWGTAATGGANGGGVVFRITLAGEYSVAHSFSGSDGATPRARLSVGTDGLFYGTTQGGGSAGWGTVFKMDLQGNVTTLHSFAGAPADGAEPIGPVLQAQDGRLYGTTNRGGANDQGSIWRIGVLQRHEHLMHSFAADGVDGNNPWSGLMQASNGRFYGTTATGGPLPSVCNGGAGCGTIYEITADGRYHVVHQFDTGPGGQYPLESLFEAADGRLYGATYGDANLPANRLGAIFSIRQR
ncbi:MAG: choice-of-anchor tandem repeat GloVer-containing protein [Vitreoscilla sp.]